MLLKDDRVGNSVASGGGAIEFAAMQSQSTSREREDKM